jgi:hypothetical protein
MLLWIVVIVVIIAVIAASWGDHSEPDVPSFEEKQEELFDELDDDRS